MMCNFVVLGPPVGKERPRVFRDARGKSRAVTPRRTRQYERTVRNMAMLSLGRLWPQDGRYQLHVRYTGRCDGDNVFKAVADALQGVAYANDKQIERGSHERLRDKPARTEIKIMVMPTAQVKPTVELMKGYGQGD